MDLRNRCLCYKCKYFLISSGICTVLNQKTQMFTSCKWFEEK